MTVWVVPIETVTNRYSEMWNRLWPEWWPFAEFIAGDDTFGGEIRQGDFLDIVGTNIYKASQVFRIGSLIRAGEIKEGDVLFFHDLWFPLTPIFYMLDCLGLDVKVAGILHCGSYARHDLLHRSGMNDWACDVERGWFRRVDRIYAFSHHHLRLLEQHRGVSPSKVCVVPFPYDLLEIKSYRSTEKRLEVVYPNRPGPDKGNEVVEKLRAEGIEVFETWKECNDREEYLTALGQAKYAVSWPPSETYGIAMMEAGWLGAMPLVPRRLSYRDLYGKTFRSLDDVIAQIKSGLVERMTGPWDNIPQKDEYRLCRVCNPAGPIQEDMEGL